MAVSISGLMNRSFAGVFAVGLAILLTSEASGADDVLAGTERLTLDQPVDAVMIEGLRRFCLRELAGSPAERAKLWQPHLVNPATFAARATAARQRLRVILGAGDQRLTVAPAEAAAFELMTTLDQSSVVARTAFVTVHRVRWPVIDGVTAEGLLLVPQSVRAGVVALPDADWTPEMFCGLRAGVPESVQFAGRLAEAGCMVAIPVLISRSDEFSGHPNVTFTNQPHCEFLYRQAFEVGRHVIGFEVLKTLVVTGDRGDGAPGSLAAIESFAAGLGLTRSFTGPVESWQTENKQQKERPTASELALAREKRQFDELQAHVQNLMLKSHQIRDDRWRLDPTAIEVWKQRQPDLRTSVHEELIGRLPHARLPLRPRSRKVLETAGYAGYEVVLDVFDDVIEQGCC